MLSTHRAEQLPPRERVCVCVCAAAAAVPGQFSSGQDRGWMLSAGAPLLSLPLSTQAGVTERKTAKISARTDTTHAHVVPIATAGRPTDTGTVFILRYVNSSFLIDLARVGTCWKCFAAFDFVLLPGAYSHY